MDSLSLLVATNQLLEPPNRNVLRFRKAAFASALANVLALNEGAGRNVLRSWQLLKADASALQAAQ